MKTKKIAIILAAALGATALASCTDSDKRLKFNDYWKENCLTPAPVNETLTYEVTFDKNDYAVKGLGYSVEYGVGEYVATLKDSGNGYSYTTSLTIDVTYVYGTESATFTDSVKSEVLLENAGKSLRAISSKKTVVSHSPASRADGSLKSCYTHFDFDLVTTYKDDDTASAQLTYRETEDAKALTEAPVSFNYGKGDYSYMDNELLLLALRAIDADTASGTVKTYNPAVKASQKVKISYSEKDSYIDKRTVIENSVETTKDVAYRVAEMVISEENPGGTQVAWIAKTTNPERNEHRNVLLRLETPISYSVGSLIYELKSIQR